MQHGGRQAARRLCAEGQVVGVDGEVRCPWTTGALSRDEVHALEVDAPRPAAPIRASAGRRTKPRTASFITLMVFRYAAVTASRTASAAFQFCQKKKVVGSGR